jgi:precorrin-6B methylase 2
MTWRNIIGRKFPYFLYHNAAVAGVLVLTLFAGGSLPLWSQAEHPVSGRRIAPVMGIGGADWLERSEREFEELPETALNAMDVRKGMTVADVGAGTGYFTIRLANRVGPTGKVYAVDVQPEMISLLRKRLDRAGIKNVVPIVGAEADPKLPPGQLDMILMVDVYHELSRPQTMLQALRAALKPTGRLILIEYKKEDPAIPIRPEHKMSVKEVRAEVEPEGFKMEKVLRDLPRQHIIIFSKQSM